MSPAIDFHGNIVVSLSCTAYHSEAIFKQSIDLLIMDRFEKELSGELAETGFINITLFSISSPDIFSIELSEYTSTRL